MMHINLEWVSEDSIEIESNQELKDALFLNGMDLLSDCTFHSTESGDKHEKQFFISPTTQVYTEIQSLLKEDEVKEKHGDIPWHQMYGIRNILAHAYIIVDRKIIWDTVVNDIPRLRKAIEDIGY